MNNGIKTLNELVEDQTGRLALMDHLDPEIIYRFNQSFLLNWKSNSLGYVPRLNATDETYEKVAHFTLSFFSSHTRTFHWVSVNRALWNYGDISVQAIIRNLLKDILCWLDKDAKIFHLQPENSETRTINTQNNLVCYLDFHEDENKMKRKIKRQCIWEKFLDDLPDENIYQNSKKHITTILKELTDKDIDEVLDIDEKMTRTVMALYSGFHLSGMENIESLVIRWLKGCKLDDEKRFYLEGRLANYPKGEAQTPPFDWFIPEPKWTKNSGRLKEFENVRHPSLSTNYKPTEDREKEDSVGSQELIELFFYHLLSLPDEYGETLAESRHLVLAPIFEIWRGQRGFGGIKGVALLWFKSNEKEEEKEEEKEGWMQPDSLSSWLENHKLSVLSGGLSGISAEIFSSALTMAVSKPIAPPYDLLRHFLRVIPYIQDWESATVFNNDGKEQYRYVRTKENGNVKCGWEYQSANPSSPNLAECKTCGKCPEPEPGEVYKCEICERFYLWWSRNAEGNDGNLWDDSLIPGLGSQEKEAFDQYSIRFEFPRAAYVPSTPESINDRLFMRGAYLRQQLELMRLLIPKVQARRSALRSAVSAIMGRNMSHNIGSHVIARQISHIKDDREKAHDEGIDHRESFFSYLQRRMDFLAEIGTTDKSSWEQPLSIERVLDVLNYDKEIATIKGKESNPLKEGSRPILLHLISGKDGLKSTVTLESKTGAFFSCPGGEVGVHALYVVLENIIRNSARHNFARGSQRDTVSLRVIVEDAELSEGDVDEGLDPKQFLQVTIVDEGSEIKSSDNKLVETLNDIFKLTSTGFLDDDLSPNTKYWGLREMQVCAHYLRGIPLTELEGPLLRTLKSIRAIEYDSSVPGEKNLAYQLFLKKGQILAYVVLGEGDDRPEPDGCRKITVASADDCNWEVVVAREARGYSFLWIPEELKASGNSYRLPSRTVTGDCSDLDKILKSAFDEFDGGSTNGLGWTESLHARVMNKYRENPERPNNVWAQRPVKIVFFPDTGNEVALIDETPTSADMTLVNGQFKMSLTEEPKTEVVGVEYPLKTAAEFLCEMQNTASNPMSRTSVNLAIIDHANDTNLWGWDDQTESWKDKDSSQKGIRAACLMQRLEGRRTGRFQNWAAVEPVFSSSLHRQALDSAKEEHWRLHELAAALFARVVILDERVQAVRASQVRSAVTLWKSWAMCGIWVPFHPKDRDGGEAICSEQMYHDPKVCCDLDHPTFGDLKKFLLRPSLVKRQLPADFLVIHLTILERLNAENNDGSEKGKKETLAATLASLLEGTALENAQVVIVTGRGMPAIARKNSMSDIQARHLPISTLLEHVSSRPSKLGLMRALWAATSIH